MAASNENEESSNIQIILNDATKKIMQELKALTGNNNRSDLIRTSLKVFHLIETNKKAGNSIVIEKPDGSKETIHIIT
jgi:hypothetical protein